MRLLILIVLLLCSLVISAQSSIKGTVYDEATNEPILFGTVALIHNGQVVKGVETDLHGHYIFDNVPPGDYVLEASYVGYTPTRTKNIKVSSKLIVLNIEIEEGMGWCGGIIFNCGYNLFPYIHEPGSGATFTSEAIRSMPIPR